MDRRPAYGYGYGCILYGYGYGCILDGYGCVLEDGYECIWRYERNMKMNLYEDKKIWRRYEEDMKMDVYMNDDMKMYVYDMDI